MREIERDQSYGLIVFDIAADPISVLLVHHRAGHWAFPKGHSEIGEEPIQTALRETKEETSVTVELDGVVKEPLGTESFFVEPNGIPRRRLVTYYLAQVRGHAAELSPKNPDEIKAARFIPYTEVASRLTYDSARVIYQVAEAKARELRIIRE